MLELRPSGSMLLGVVTLAIGALLEPGLLTASSRAAQQSPVTFVQVAPILFNACASCHRPAGSAPFSLLSYQDARPWAKSIKQAVLQREMPPWKPEPGYGEFAGERRLSDDEIAVIQKWVDDGAIEGDAALLPPLPKWSGRWQLGEPDLVLQTERFVLRATGDDMYRNFVLSIPGDVTRFIKAWEFLPGNPRVVHHATMQFDRAGLSRQRDAEDPLPGYEGLIAHSVRSPDGFFLDWGPGHSPYVAPNGMAWPLEKGADLVMMLHLRPSGKEEPVQATLGVYFSDAPPSLNPALIRLTRQHLDIPPGERNYFVSDSFKLDVDVDLYTVQPHAHYLAKDVKGFATLPDGTRKWLVYIREWDFDWQGVYRYARPVSLPAGATITMEYVYDNSAENPHRPPTPPRRVTYGQRTTDEMAELWFQAIARNPADRATLARAVQSKVLREEIVGHEKMLEAEPTNVALHDGVALLYAESGNLDQTAAHFAATLRVIPDSPAANYNLGTALLLQGKRDEAGGYFTKALALKPDYALAHDRLGLVRQGQGRLSDALDHFQQAVTFDPRSVDAHYHLATALRNDARLTEAVRHYRFALQLDPTRQVVKTELAEVERQIAAEAAGRR
jgi:tetratricopeptide (TPR) repeat protein